MFWKKVVAWIGASVLLSFFVTELVAQEYGPDNSPCDGRSIPQSKRRKFRNLRLECASNVDHFIRRPFPIKKEIHEKLYQFELLEKWDEMQQFRQQIEPLIEWKGRIDYETLEVWEWTDWVYGHHSSCPPKIVTRTETHTDSEGKQHTQIVTDTEPQPCWHDEDRTEREHCSFEKMTYQAHFHRPSLEEWGPPNSKYSNRTGKYYSILPNKYDLLPGEMEDVQIYNTTSSFLSSASTTMNPAVVIGDAWNNYDFEIQFTEGGSGSAVTCRYHWNYHMNVTLYTKKRLTDKRTPNAFRVPVDEYGNETSPFANWTVEQNGSGEDVRLKPTTLALTDSSSLLISALSRQSRIEPKEILEEKLKQGEGSNASEADVEKMEHDAEMGFWKDTHVKIQLYEVTPIFVRDIRATKNLFTRGADSIEFQDTEFLDQYRVKLDTEDFDRDLYRMSAQFFGLPLDQWIDFGKYELLPGKKYEMRIVMFQEGVPFYRQKHWYNNYWSKPLVIPFTRERGFDKRSTWHHFLNWRKKFFLRW